MSQVLATPTCLCVKRKHQRANRKGLYSRITMRNLSFTLRRYRFLFVVLLALESGVGQDTSTLASNSDCNAPAHDAISYVSMPGRPFGIAVSRNGCWVFVAVMGDKSSEGSKVALLHRSEGKTKVEKTFSLNGRATDIVLTHDEKLLIVAGDEDVAFLDSQRMLTGKGDPVLGYLAESDAKGSINVNVTRDDKFLFVSDEGSASIRVIDLEKVRSTKFSSKAVIGRIPVGLAPIALVFSPDEKLLYSTSEVVKGRAGWEDKCKPGRRSLWRRDS